MAVFAVLGQVAVKIGSATAKIAQTVGQAAVKAAHATAKATSQVGKAASRAGQSASRAAKSETIRTRDAYRQQYQQAEGIHGRMIEKKNGYDNDCGLAKAAAENIKNAPEALNDAATGNIIDLGRKAMSTSRLIAKGLKAGVLNKKQAIAQGPANTAMLLRAGLKKQKDLKMTQGLSSGPDLTLRPY